MDNPATEPFRPAAPVRKRGRPTKAPELRSYQARFANELRRWREEELRYSQQELAEAVGYSRTYIGQIERAEKLPELLFIEKTSDVLPVPERLRTLYDAASQEQTVDQHRSHLRRRLDLDANEVEVFSSLVATSHQIIPLWCKALYEHVMENGLASVRLGSPPSEFKRLTVDSSIDLFGSPFGSVIVCKSDEVEFSSIAELASWQRSEHDRVLDQIHDQLIDTLGISCDHASGRYRTDYVFSFYFVASLPVHTQTEKENAISLLSTPTMLIPAPTGEITELSSDEMQRARAVERSVLRSGVSSSGMVQFGMTATSIGCASWDALAYMPLSETRALRSDAIVNLEVRLQALWSYCHHILSNGQLEFLEDPMDLSQSFVMSCLSDLALPGATETMQYCLMREAIVKTSRIEEMVNHAVKMMGAGPV